MARYKKILVAIDGSSTSIHALEESFRFAQNEGTWITVVFVIPAYTGDLDLVVGNIISSMRKPCEEVLGKTKDIAEKHNVLIKRVCEEGEPYERIIDLAQAENCDLIVMGRRGLSRLERVLVGSVTARVIGYSPIDVLVVPSHTSIKFKNIFIATDGSFYSKAAERKAIDFAKSYGGSLTVISVVDVPPEFYAESPQAVEDLIKKTKEYVNSVKKQAEAEGVKAETVVKEGEAYRVIVETAMEKTGGIIVMGSHGRTGLKRLLMGSVTEKVIGYAPCPVLVVK